MFHVEHLPGVCHAANSAGVSDGGKARRSLQGAASPTPRGGVRAAAFWDNAAVGQASAEGSRPLPTDGVHGCFVGNGQDRSGDVCRCCMVKYCCGVGATIGRPPTYRSNAFSGIVSCKANGRLWETRGPGMPGPYRAAAPQKAGLPLTPSPQTPLLPPSRRSPPFPPYRRC